MIFSLPLSKTAAAFSTSAVDSARKLSMEEIVSLCKRRGFIFTGSEIYGSIGVGYDYGPLGLALKKNVTDLWWKDFVKRRSDCVGIETSLIMNPLVWEASGHVSQFVDPLTECASCRKRVRADKLVGEGILKAKKEGKEVPEYLLSVNDPGTLSLPQLGDALRDLGIECPDCKAKGEAGLGIPRTFNLLFTTHVGPVLPGDAPSVQSSNPIGDGSQERSPEDEGQGDGSGRSKQKKKKKDALPKGLPKHGLMAYVRPETAQGAFVQFQNVVQATRRRLPLGLGQVGKSFRNEIATSHFVFRTREFEQAELEFFCHPQESKKWYDYWVQYCFDWLVRRVGLSPDSVRFKNYDKNELAHYALDTTDIEFKYPFGWEELWGIANRGDFDLQCHSKASGISLRYTDPVSNEVCCACRLFFLSHLFSNLNYSPPHTLLNIRSFLSVPVQTFFPHVVEPALGVNRLILALLTDGFVVENETGTQKDTENLGASNEKAEPRTVLRIHEDIAPVKVAILPLLKREPQVAIADTLLQQLLEHIDAEMDTTGSLGKRYRRYDEIGTPICITIDHDTVNDNTVTLRDRDSMQQIRMPIVEVMERAKNGTLKPSCLSFS